jgi:ubiquinone biosynthesis protein
LQKEAAMQLKHADRYRKLASLFTRYALRDFKLQTSGSVAIKDEEEEKNLEPTLQKRAKAFAHDLEEMGPTFIKFGQLLSTRPDIVPHEYIVELEKFQDDMEPFSFAEVERIVQEELETKISKLFDDFEDQPVAAASLGQVHQAVLRDGRRVMVKVQRPDIHERIEEDLEIFHELAEFLEEHAEIGQRLNLTGAVREFERTLRNELDYRQEARNAAALRRNLASFEEIYIPATIEDLTTSKVLTMELIEGTKISSLTGIQKTEHDYSHLAETLTTAYIKQICVDGFWHSDPHPGNIFLRDGKIVLLDFGMVAQISGEFQDHVVRLLLNLSENRGEQVAETCLRMGRPEEGFERRRYIEDVTSIISLYQGYDFQRLNTGQLIFQVINVAAENHVRLPAELTLLAKTLLHLDSITTILNPEFAPPQVIRDYAEELVIQKLRQRFHPKNFYTALLDLNYLAGEVPRRARDILEEASTGRFTMRIRLADVEDLLKGVHRIANRITEGLVIAALLVASALMMNVEGGFTLFGYNGFSVIGFTIAVTASVWLIFQTLVTDRKDRKSASIEKPVQ